MFFTVCETGHGAKLMLMRILWPEPTFADIHTLQFGICLLLQNGTQPCIPERWLFSLKLLFETDIHASSQEYKTSELNSTQCSYVVWYLQQLLKTLNFQKIWNSLWSIRKQKWHLSADWSLRIQTPPPKQSRKELELLEVPSVLPPSQTCHTLEHLDRNTVDLISENVILPTDNLPNWSWKCEEFSHKSKIT